MGFTRFTKTQPPNDNLNPDCLQYLWLNPLSDAMAKVRITINNNGSTRVEALDGAELEIVDASGAPYGLGGRTTVSLCRCGLSQNKPFCDGAHRGHFEHSAVAFDLPPKPS